MRGGRGHRARMLGRALAAGALLAAFLCPVARATASTEAFVRVNQVGYPTKATKRAYVIASFEDAGAAWTLQRSNGATVASGTLGAPVGSWSKAYPDVYTIDFDAVHENGSYRVLLEGPAPAASPPFVIASPSSLYPSLLANTLSFYQNERDGPEYIPSALRTAPGHLNDEHAETYVTPKVNGGGSFKGELAGLDETINAAGGWWDAGDYLKFVQTTSYTVDLMLAGVRNFPASLGSESSLAFTAEARFGVEWLLRMWNDSTGTLYYQVGIGEGNRKTVGDHDIWRLPQEDDDYGGENPLYRFIRHRPVFRAGPPGSPVSPNLAGRDAAAFGLCFQVFHTSDPALAERCLHAGEHIFELANTSPHRLLTTIPYDFYPEKEWRDDMELGATELSLALSSTSTPPAGLPHTEPSYYLAQATNWAAQYDRHAKNKSDTLNLYDVSGLADFELARALRAAGNPPGLAVDEATLIASLGGELEGAEQQSRSDPFGFGFPWAAADTTSHGDGLVVMADEYDWLTGSEKYATSGNRWLGNVLGANAWGSSLIIGDGTVFPHCPQHQVANLVGSLDGSPPILAGAAVEGPTNEPSSGEVAGMRPCPASATDEFTKFDNGAMFEDNVQAYTSVEPAIDLTASSILAFAWQIEDPITLG